MDKNVIQGKAKQAMGAAKQKVGEVTGNREMEAKGAAKRAEGKVQEGVGKTKDAVRDGIRNLKH